jgi:hypothetical protein
VTHERPGPTPGLSYFYFIGEDEQTASGDGWTGAKVVFTGHLGGVNIHPNQSRRRVVEVFI